MRCVYPEDKKTKFFLKGMNSRAPVQPSSCDEARPARRNWCMPISPQRAPAHAPAEISDAEATLAKTAAGAKGVCDVEPTRVLKSAQQAQPRMRRTPSFVRSKG